MLKLVAHRMGSRTVMHFRERMLPKHEPRCAGAGCAERASCERYQRAVYEANARIAQRGNVLAVSLAESDGTCWRKM